jgi:nitrate/nitrite transporter NarK
MLKLASHWMPARNFAFVSGVAIFTGVLGATLAGAPLRIAVDAAGWRTVMVITAAITAAVALGIWTLVRDDPSQRGYASYYPVDAGVAARPSIGAQLAQVARYRNPWLLFVASGGFCGIILTFPGLWGVPFLVTQHGFTTREAAMTASAMLLAWSTSTMAFGPLSQRMGRRKPVYIGGLVVTLALWSVVILFPALPRAALVAVLIALSIASGTFILTFAFAKESVPAHLGGTASGIANMGVMCGGMLMQPLVGVMLDRHWNGTVAEGARIYDFAAYRWGFSLMLAWGVLALVLVAFTRESHCRPLR